MLLALVEKPCLITYTKKCGILVDLDILKQSVITLTRQVGDFILKESSNFDRAKDTEFKGINNMVSYVDKESERELVRELSLCLPHAGFIAEEGTGVPQEGGLNWVIDPLDGTTNFIHKIPTFSVSVALMNGNDILLGVVYEPNRQEMFSAVKGGGAFLNDHPIRVSTVRKMSESLIATGFPYEDSEKMAQYLQLLYTFVTKSHGFRRIGSAAVDLAYVACGRYEGFYEYGLNPWDVAAGALLVKEAGGHVTDFNNADNFVFGNQIIASGNIQEEMLHVLKKHFLI